MKNSISDRNEYANLFKRVTNEKAIGESSTSYLYTRAAIEKIKIELPGVRLIAVLRNPVDRAFASYLGLALSGLEPCKDFRTAIHDEPRRLAENWIKGCYISQGYYFRHLGFVYKMFDPEKIRVYLYEDFRDEQKKTLRDIFDFLGVDEGFVPDTSIWYNPSGVIRNPMLKALWTKTSTLRARLRPYAPSRLRHLPGKLMLRNVDKPELDPELRSELEELYREDIVKLQDLIKRDLSHWLSSRTQDR